MCIKMVHNRSILNQYTGDQSEVGGFFERKKASSTTTTVEDRLFKCGIIVHGRIFQGITISLEPEIL